MAIKDQIEVILKKRKEKARRLEDRRQEVEDLRSALETAKNTLNLKSLNITNEEMKNQYSEIYRKIDIIEIRQTADQLIASIDKAVQRFDRNYISIATVGKERQGKSKLLQSIGGLDDEIGNKVIPAFDAGSCTGAVSVIYNDPAIPRGQVRATVYFRTPEMFLDIIRGYIVQIDPDYFRTHNLYFENIPGIDFAYLKSLIEFGDISKENALIYLQEIVNHFSEIRPLFGAPPRVLTDPDEIQSFVAMNNGKPSAAEGRVEFINYLAVTRADIGCAFFSDVGKVRLVDTVGIGTTQNGAEDAMLETVDKESDAVIVVSRPNMASIQKEDMKIYNVLRDRFKNRELDKWLFYLVNKVKTENLNNENSVYVFKKGIEERGFAIAGCEIVNAGDPLQVQDHYLLPVLNSLMGNLDDIDKVYQNEIDNAEEAFQIALSRFRRNLPAALPRINMVGIQGQQAQVRGQEFYANILATHLRDIVKEWSEVKDDTDDDTLLWRNIEPLLDRLDRFVPSPEEIDAILHTNGNILPDQLWDLMLHNIRTSLTDSFLSIDNELERNIREFKNSLVKPLYHELRSITDDQEHLENDEQSDMVEWLKSMMDTVLSNSDYYKQIRKGFEFLYEFKFNTRMQLIQEVRRQLYIINPICSEYARPEWQFTYDNCGNEIHFYLTSRLAVIEDELRYHLRKLYSSPNLALYAAAEEFYDRLIFASERQGTKLIDMREVWGRFFQEYSEKLCTSDTALFNSVNGFIETYNNMLETVDGFAVLSGKTTERRGA